MGLATNILLVIWITMQILEFLKHFLPLQIRDSCTNLLVTQEVVDK